MTTDVRAALAPLWPHVAHAVNACIANAIRAGRPETRTVLTCSLSCSCISANRSPYSFCFSSFCVSPRSRSPLR